MTSQGASMHHLLHFIFQYVILPIHCCKYKIRIVTMFLLEQYLVLSHDFIVLIDVNKF